mgnify:CR=1 FL=1
MKEWYSLEEEEGDDRYPQKRAKVFFIRAILRRRKEASFDEFIQNQKKVNLVCKIKDILVKEPGKVMPLRHLYSHRRKLGFTDRHKLSSVIMKYPRVFQVFEEGSQQIYFGLSEEAERLFLEENRLKEEQEGILVEKIRKLLMMSVDKTLLLYKISHLRKDLGLPDDFKTNLVLKYPQFFNVIETEEGTALELASWDPALAISTYEKSQKNQTNSKNKEENRYNRRIQTLSSNLPMVKLPKGYLLKRKEKEVLKRFQDMSYMSPYMDITNLEACSRQAEKHACAVLHEILSMTLEKKIVIDYLTHFKRDYKFSIKLQTMLLRHPDQFYVSSKGGRDSVFLREAYNGSELIEKDSLLVVKEKLGKLMERETGNYEEVSNDNFYDEVDENVNGDDDNDSGDDNVCAVLDCSNEEDEVKKSQWKSEEVRPLLQRLSSIQKEQAMATVGPQERW